MSDGLVVLRDAAGQRRSPATMPGYLAGDAPRNKGMEYPPDPPRPEEIVRVMRQAGHDRHGLRVRALIAVVWRGGLRISEALALNETDIDPARGSVLVRHGKGDKRREAGMDQFGFQQVAEWQVHRVVLPPGPLFCVIDGMTRGRRWSATAAREELRHLAAYSVFRRRFAPHQLRHTHAVELAREGVRDDEHHPTPARPHRSWNPLGLYPGHRPERDHRHGPLTTAADHLDDRRALPLATWGLSHRPRVDAMRQSSRERCLGDEGGAKLEVTPCPIWRVGAPPIVNASEVVTCQADWPRCGLRARSGLTLPPRSRAFWRLARRTGG